MSDITDDIEGLVGVYEVHMQIREQQWREGIHEDREGNEHKISTMSKSHLENTIKYFQEDHDVTPLKKELKKRK